jgi:hypothetical protein
MRTRLDPSRKTVNCRVPFYPRGTDPEEANLPGAGIIPKPCPNRNPRKRRWSEPEPIGKPRAKVANEVRDVVHADDDDALTEEIVWAIVV